MNKTTEAAYYAKRAKGWKTLLNKEHNLIFLKWRGMDMPIHGKGNGWIETQLMAEYMVIVSPTA
ncbi:hypothetical protein MASR1M31_02170 [Porphyromonadaceae bacterium]